MMVDTNDVCVCVCMCACVCAPDQSLTTKSSCIPTQYLYVCNLVLSRSDGSGGVWSSERRRHGRCQQVP